jgi:hypothetical protein
MPRRKTKKRNTIKKIIKSMINNNIETKTAVHNYTTIEVSNVGVNHDITALAQGLQQQDRVGNQIKLTSFRLKGCFYSDYTHDLVRVIIYIPKNVNELLATSTTPTDPLDQDKYTILSDRLIPLSNQGSPVKPYNKVILFNKGLRNGLNVHYTTNLASSCTKNQLMVYMCSGSGASPHPKFSGYWRFYFKDA